jgi:hypothetical protein
MTWAEVTEERYNEMLEILWPAEWLPLGFLVGEPWDHDPATGRPRFTAFVQVDGKHYEALAPMSIPEFRNLRPGDVRAAIAA